MYDMLTGTSHHDVAKEWWRYHARNYMPRDAAGKVVGATMYYDPVLDHNHISDAIMGLGAAWYALPQAPELAREMYEAAVEQAGWRDPETDVGMTVARARMYTLGLVVARELNDHVVADRLRDTIDRVMEPRLFGADEAEFGWFMHLDEPWPRGQINSLLICDDIMTSTGPGMVCAPPRWSTIFTDASFAARSTEPTVEAVEFPDLGISEAYNDAATGTLVVATYVGARSAVGRPTSFRVTQVPTRSPEVLCDGTPYHNWDQAPDGVLTIRFGIANHRFVITTGAGSSDRASL